MQEGNTKMSSIVKKMFMNRLSLIAARERISNAALAKRCNLNTQDIQRYLTGNATPSIDKLAKIASAFDLTTDWLLGLSNTDMSSYNQDPSHKIEQVREKAARFCAAAADLNVEAKGLKQMLEKMF